MHHYIDYLKFTAKSSGTFNFSGTQNNEITNMISYSMNDDKTWSEPAQTVSVNVNTGDIVYWKGEMTPIPSSGIGKFTDSTAEFDIGGNVMALLYGDNYNRQNDLTGKEYTFYYLFNNTKCINADNLTLPATILSENCYRSMFKNCTSLLTSPVILPAMTLMFQCYMGMFQGCSSLINAPELPATTLSINGYANMFGGCESLTSAPELNATTLVQQSYAYMFNGCTNLNYIKMLATTVSAENCLNNWVNGVAVNGTFIKNANTTIPSGISGIPEGWTVQDATE